MSDNPAAFTPRDLSSLGTSGEVAAWTLEIRKHALWFVVLGVVILAAMLGFNSVVRHSAGHWGMFAALLATAISIRIRPAWTHPVFLALIAFGTAFLFLRAWPMPPDQIRLSLDFLVYVSICSTVFVGVRAGDLVTGISLAGILAPLSFQSGFSRDVTGHLINVSLVLVIQHLVLRKFWLAMREGVEEMAQRGQALREGAEVAHHLVSHSFVKARQGVKAILRGLDAGGGEGLTAAETLSNDLQQARENLPPGTQPGENPAFRERQLAIQSSLMSLVLVLGFIGSLLLVIRNFHLEKPSFWMLVGQTVVMGTTWFVGRKRPAFQRPAFAIGLSLEMASLVWGAWLRSAQGVESAQVGLAGLVLAIFIAALVHSFWLASILFLMRAFDPILLSGSEHPYVWAHAIGGIALSLATAWMLWRLPHNLAARLASQAEEQAQLLTRRRRLVSTLFHDLANPLQVILYMLDKPNPEQDTVRALTLRMGDVLDASERLDRGESVLRLADIDLLIRESVEVFRKRLKDKNLELDLRLKPHQALVQPELLRESVVGNLLGNAIKFSPPGGRIELSLTSGRNGAEIRIRDHGPGVPVDVTKALSARTIVPSRPGSIGEKGSGYGLLLARDYLQQMQGDLSLQSAPDGGCLAVVTLGKVRD